MYVFELIILGLIQGLTEFIPISSSGHLVIAQTVLSGASDHLLLEYLNIGTMLALFVYFRHRIKDILRDIFVHRQYSLARNVIITVLPAGLLGFFLSDFIGSAAFFGSAIVVAVTLFVVGVIMVVLEKLPRASSVSTMDKLPPRRALWIGLAQACALIPGVSRSGSTIIAGRLAGFSPAQAAEYSFLASLPIMAGVTVKVLIGDTQYLIDNFIPLLAGNVFAFISGVVAVGFLMRYLANHGLAVFGWYRIGLSAVLTAVLLLQ